MGKQSQMGLAAVSETDPPNVEVVRGFARGKRTVNEAVACGTSEGGVATVSEAVAKGLAAVSEAAPPGGEMAQEAVTR